MRIVVALACTLLVLFTTPARAGQPDAFALPQLELPDSTTEVDISRPWPPPSLGIRRAQAATESVPDDVERRIAELKFERDGIDVRGPRGAMIAGSVTTGVASAYLILVGGLCGDCGASGRLYGTAGGFLFAGLVTLGTSLAFLVPRTRQIRAIDREILDLEHRPESHARRVSPVRVSFEAGQRKSLGLHWQF